MLEIIVVMFSHFSQPQKLQCPCNQHREDGDCKAYGDSLKLREAVVVACELSRERDDQTVVDGDPDYDAEGVEEGERGGGDFEGGANVEVHCVALEDKQGSHLAVHGGEDYTGGPYRKES